MRDGRGKKKPNKSSRGKNRRPLDDSEESDLGNGPADEDDSSEANNQANTRPDRLQKGGKNGGKGRGKGKNANGATDSDLNDGDLEGEPKDSNEDNGDSDDKNAG